VFDIAYHKATKLLEIEENKTVLNISGKENNMCLFIMSSQLRMCQLEILFIKQILID